MPHVSSRGVERRCRRFCWGIIANENSSTLYVTPVKVISSHREPGYCSCRVCVRWNLHLYVVCWLSSPIISNWAWVKNSFQWLPRGLFIPPLTHMKVDGQSDSFSPPRSSLVGWHRPTPEPYLLTYCITRMRSVTFSPCLSSSPRRLPLPSHPIWR